jgi:hypothetical protein
MTTVHVISAGLVALLATAAVQAATITYDESVNGDAGSFNDAPVALGDLNVGDTYLLTGSASLLGSQADGYDYFTFTAASGFSVDLTEYSPGGGTLTSGFRIYDSGLSFLGGFNYGAPTDDIYSSLGLGAGTYTFGVTEFGATSPASYTFSLSLDISPVPLPASLAFLLAGLGALAALRRRE